MKPLFSLLVLAQLYSVQSIGALNLGRCVRDMTFFAHSRFYKSLDFKNAEALATEINAGRVNKRTFNKLYIVDWVSFDEALDAAKSIGRDDFSLSDYRDLRDHGVDHRTATEWLSDLSPQDRVKPGWLAGVQKTEEWFVSSGIAPVEAQHVAQTLQNQLGFLWRFWMPRTALDYVILRKSDIAQDEALEAVPKVEGIPYLRVRQHGIDHESAMEAAHFGFVKEYLELRDGGVTHNDAIAVIRGVEDTADYLKLIKNADAKVHHSQAVEFLRRFDDVEEYLKIRGARDFKVSHEEAMEVFEHMDTASEYLALRERFKLVTHDEAIEVLRSVGDGQDYARIRAANVDHEMALRIVETIDDGNEFLRIINDGRFKVTDEEALEIVRDYGLEEEYRELRAFGANHSQAMVILDNSSSSDDFVKLRQGGIPVDEAVRAIEAGYDAKEYVQIRMPTKDPLD